MTPDPREMLGQQVTLDDDLKALVTAVTFLVGGSVRVECSYFHGGEHKITLCELTELERRP